MPHTPRHDTDPILAAMRAEAPAPPRQDSPDLPDPKQRVAWVAAVAQRGLTRIYAASIDCPAPQTLTDDACDAIDRVFEQAAALCREGLVAHAQCTRWGHDLIVLVADDARYDWVIPALQKRLCDELARLHLDLDLERTQLVDLARGQPLRLWSFELRLALGGAGRSR